MWDIAIFHENAGFKKKTFLFAAIGQTGYQNRNKYLIFKKKTLESIGASFSKVSLIEPEIFKVKEWF